MKHFKNRHTAVLLIALGILPCALAGISTLSAPTTALALEVEYGSGTEGDIYLISSADELYTLSQTNSDWGKKFKLTQNINLSSVCGANLNGESVSWSPIGANNDKHFTGTFDGADHTISGLYIDSTEGWQGLFGYVENGTIKNLTVKGTVSGKGYVGGIVGYFDVSTVEKCYFEGAVKGGSSGQPIGGIVGYNRSGTINKCNNRGEISCLNEYAGGIVGQNYGTNAKVTDCENTGTISLIDSTGKGSTVGGIVGINVSGSKITNCRNTGTIGEGNNLIVGGIVGKNNGGSVTQCYNTGAVIGSQYIGGVAGQSVAQAKITECYNTGAVSGSQYIGGVAGQNDDGASIMSCYNTATVTGSSNVGGLVGQNCGGTSKRPTLGTVKNSYNRGAVTGSGNVGGVVGLNIMNTSAGTVSNCFYLTGTAAGGINNADTDGAKVKTEAAFNSGEISWLLQNGQATQAWGQLLKGNEQEIDKYPVLTDQLPKRVWKASFIKNGETIYVTYVNNGGTITPPTDDEWYESNGTRFNSTVQITEDTILGLSVRFGAVTNNLITLDYGQSAERNLDEWLEYEDGSSTQDRFTYTIVNSDGLTEAYIEDSLLKIPSGANVKEGGYVLQIKAHEKKPLVDTAVRNISTFAVTDFGKDDVTFNVQVVIKKIDQAPLQITDLPVSVTYLDRFTLKTEGGTGNGEVTWTVTAGQNFAEINANGEVTVKGVGVVEITATKSGGINYNDVTDKISFTINKANQGSFTIKELPQSVTYKDASFTLEAEGGTGSGTVTWEVTAGNEYADINASGVVTIKGAGIIEITATKAGGANYYDISDKIVITINKANQDDFKITGLPLSVTYGDKDFTLSTEGGTGSGAVTWAVTAGNDYAVIDANGKVTIKGAGTVEITATKSGGNNYNDIIDVIRFTVYKANQDSFRITGLPGNVTYGDDDFTLSTAGGSGTGAVTWEVTAGSDYAAINANGVVTIKGAGTFEITATKAEDANFNAISDKITVTINKANQPDFKITGLPQSVTFGDTDFELATEGGVEGGTVTWEVTQGKAFAEIDENGKVTIKGVGYVEITATKAGGDNYNDILDVIHFTVNKANQAPFTITELPGSVTYGDQDFTLSTEGGTGNGGITWEVTVGKDYAEIDANGKVTIKGAGAVEITVIKAGGDNYYDISDTIDFTINKANQTEFKITGLPGYIEYEDSFTLQTDGGSGKGAVTWEVTVGGEYAEIDSDGKVTIKGVGYVEITATKASDLNYNAAIAMVSFTVNKENQAAFAITGLPASIAYEDVFTLQAKGGTGGGAIAWEVTLGNEFADIDANGKVTIKGVGYVEITATKSGGDNYYDISDKVSFTINKANQPDFRIIELPSYIQYEDVFTLKTDGSKVKGTITWAVTEGRAYADVAPNGEVTILGVGYVEITATIAGDDNYNAAIAMVSFTVNKENQAAFAITGLPASIAYEDVFTLQTTGGTGGGAVTWEVTLGKEFADIDANGKVTITGVGYVEITARKAGGENYNDISDRISFTSNKANQPDFRITSLPSYIKYEDSFTLQTDGVKGSGAITWTVTLGSEYADVAPNGEVTIKGVGYVEITASLAADAHYNAASALVSFTVNKENQTAFTITGLPASIAYEDVFTLQTTGGSGGGAVTWEVTLGKEFADIAPDGTVTITGVGYVEITAIKTGGDNYNDISDKVSFTVNKANQEALTISGLLNSVTYGDKDFLLTISGGSGNGSISWDYTGKVTISANGKFATITVNGAGEVTITATKAEDEHYKAISTVISFTVNKANQADFNIIKLPAGVTYTDAPFTIEADGGLGEGAITWKATGNVTISANGKFATITVNGAGEVTITATKAEDENFNSITTIVSFTVNKANQEPFTIADVPNSVTYGDKDFTLKAQGGSGNGAVTWSVIDGNAFAEIDASGKVTIKGAGEVTITAIKAEDENFNSTLATISFTVNKANQTDFNITGLPASITFNDGAFTLTAEGGLGDGAVTWDFTGKVSLDTVGKTATVTAVGAGDVTITATKAGDNNYNAISTVISFTVNRANQSPLVISGLPLGVNYKSNSFRLIAEGGSVDGTDAVWKVTEGSNFVTVSVDGEVTIKGAGRVEITAVKAGGADYYDISTVISFTVEKAIPEYTVPEGLTAAYGDTLADVALPEGWAWDDALSTNVGALGNHTFSATFTHGDTANYNTVTLLLTVMVVKAMPDYTLPANLTATYGDTLADVALPEGWAWNDALTTKVGNAGERTFSATFTPDDTDNYNTVTIALTITVKKAIPQFTIPDGLKATVGNTLADVALPAGWAWDDALTTKVGKAGQRTFTATFTPSDTENYETVTITLTITVEANASSGFWWWWILLIVLLVMLAVVILLLILKNRKKASEEVPVAEAQASVQAPQTVKAPTAPFFTGGATDAPRYKKSFTAHVIQSSDKTKLWYSDIKNELMSYKKIHNRTSWKHETFRSGRKTVAKLLFRGKTLCLYLALNVADYIGEYRVEDAAQKSVKYAQTPLKIRLKTNKSVKIAKLLIGEAMKQRGVEPLLEHAPVDYCVPYEETEALIEKGLVKRIDKPDRAEKSDELK